MSVRGAGLNAADLLQRAGHYPAPAGWPADVPGLEAAGIVTGLGPGVDDGWRGRRVGVLLGGGGQAEQVVAPTSHLWELPDHLDWEHAGGLVEAAATAHDALVTQAGLRAGERVVVSGAAGGVGTLAIQIATQCGAEVIAVTRDGTHRDELTALGASRVLPLEEVPSLTGIDVVLELVGAAHLEQVQGGLAPRARVVVIGVGSGSRASIDLLGVMARRAHLTGSTLRSRPPAEKAAVLAAARADLDGPLASGTLRVVVAEAVPLAEAERAYELFAARGKLGKIVLTVAP